MMTAARSKRTFQGRRSNPAELAIGKGMDGETRWMFHESVQQTKFRAKTSMYSVYVGYLPLSATADEVFDLFNPIAPVRDLWLAKQTSGSTHTYGFVRFLELRECQAVMRHLNGKIFRGNKLVVEPSVSLLQRMKKNEAAWRKQDVVSASSAEAERKALLRALKLKEQRCFNFNAKTFFGVLSQLPPSLSSPGVDEGPICPYVPPSCGLGHKLVVDESNPKGKIMCTSNEVAVEAEYVASYSTGNQYSFETVIHWQSSLPVTHQHHNGDKHTLPVDCRKHNGLHPVGSLVSERTNVRRVQAMKQHQLQGRIRELQCELDTLEVEFRTKTRETALQSRVSSSGATGSVDLSLLFSIEEEMQRTEMELEMQQEKCIGRLERLEILYEKERLKQGIDVQILCEMELEINVERARQSLRVAELEGRLLSCKSQLQCPV